MSYTFLPQRVKNPYKRIAYRRTDGHADLLEPKFKNLQNEDKMHSRRAFHTGDRNRSALSRTDSHADLGRGETDRL